MEERYGKADRVWVMDRGMISPRPTSSSSRTGKRPQVHRRHAQDFMLRKYEKQLIASDWNAPCTRGWK